MAMVKSRFSSSISSSIFRVLIGSSARGRLVEQDDLGPHGDGAGDAQPLLLPARQAHGGGVQPVLHLGPERGAGQRPFHPLVHLRLRQLLVQPHAEGDVVVDGHREGRRLLEHHADLGAQRVQVDVGVDDVLAVQQHLARRPLAGIEAVHAVQHPQQRRLAAAGGADHAGDLAVREVEVDALQRLVVAVEEVEVADGDLGARSAAAPERACIAPRAGAAGGGRRGGAHGGPPLLSAAQQAAGRDVQQRARRG